MGEIRSTLIVQKHPLQGSGPSAAETVCEKCGETWRVGDWPFCPHTGGAATVSKQYPFVTKNFDGTPIEVTSAAHERALEKQFGCRKRDDVAWTLQEYKGYDSTLGKHVYKEGNGVGLPGCWI